MSHVFGNTAEDTRPQAMSIFLELECKWRDILTFLSIQFPYQFSVSCSRDLVRNRADKTFLRNNVKVLKMFRMLALTGHVQTKKRLQLEN